MSNGLAILLLLAVNAILILLIDWSALLQAMTHQWR